MKKCPDCGGENEDEAVACSSCGRVQPQASASEPSASEVKPAGDRYSRFVGDASSLRLVESPDQEPHRAIAGPAKTLAPRPGTTKATK
jgi:hypothetical protein